jgi:hypothetical protein
MSISIVRAEIERFLKSAEPEVLCISGAWGVGKTFAWNKFLNEGRADSNVALTRYAYVSLFGSNSLTDVRNAIVENTVEMDDAGAPPSTLRLRELFRRGKNYVRKSRPALDIAATILRMKDAGDTLYRAAFLTVQNQIICFDDIERAGEGLKMRDVLGLASMLREQRNCKIVLLLNKKQVAGEGEQELDLQLEKVIDTFLKFEPTSVEATTIAIQGTDEVAVLLRNRMEKLKITNIRVMKKIERWALQLLEMLETFDDQVREQAISTVTLVGWCFLQPQDAPPLAFIQSFNRWTGMFGKDDAPEEERRWREEIKEYGFSHADEMDDAIFEGVTLGYFNRTKISDGATLVAQRNAANGRDNSFSQAWERYHHTLAVDDAEILDGLYQGAVENIETVNAPSVNGTINFLRQYDRQEQASDLVAKFLAVNSDRPEFFARDNRMFYDDQVDPELHSALEAERIKHRDARDPVERLKKIADQRGFDPADDVALFSRLSSDDWLAFFDENEGPNIKNLIEWAGIIAAQEGGETMRANLKLAVDEIGARSPMRANKLKAWGVAR